MLALVDSCDIDEAHESSEAVLVQMYEEVNVRAFGVKSANEAAAGKLEWHCPIPNSLRVS
jgi:hypothetical protein